jgi:Zn-dependent protease/CBS domain-containing protein
MATQTTEPERRSGLRLMKIAGIQITIDYSWFFIFVLVVLSLSAGYFPHRFPGANALTYWLAGLVATLMLFASILVHELSHALVAQRAGIAVPEITLFLFGGVSRLSAEARDAKTEFAIAIVGPLTSFALALLFWVLQRGIEGEQSSLISTVLAYLVWINVALGIFNLLPGFPLDGGRVLRAILWRTKGSLTQATKIASNVGKGFAVALMILGGLQIFAGALIGGLWLIFIGMFLRGMAQQGYQELIMQQSLGGVDVHEVMIQDVVSVPPDMPVQRLLTEYFLRHGYHGFPVVRAGQVLGVVSLDDVRAIPEEARHTTPVEKIMQPLSSHTVIAPQTPLNEALKKMVQHSRGRLLVMQGDRLIGMITKTGLLRFLEVKRLLQEQHA